jgi:hypothetical protein
MKYTRYILNAKYVIDDIRYCKRIWTFKSKKTAQAVIDLMKEDDGDCWENLYIEKLTRD